MAVFKLGVKTFSAASKAAALNLKLLIAILSKASVYSVTAASPLCFTASNISFTLACKGLASYSGLANKFGQSFNLGSLKT